MSHEGSRRNRGRGPGPSRTWPHYDRFIASLQPNTIGRRGKRSRRGIDEAPETMEGLADYFAGLDLPTLAGCWVACLVSASTHPFTTREITMALIVVAERLHGESFDGAGGPGTDARPPATQA